MSKRKNEIFNDESLKELEDRVAKLTERSEQDLQNEMDNFSQVNEQFNAKLDKLWGKDSHSDSEVDKLLEQMQSEIKLEAKSAELNNQKDQALRDRLNRLKEETTDLSDITHTVHNEVSKTTSTRFSFDDTQSIITTNLEAQAGIAEAFANQYDDIDDKKPLADLASNLKKMSTIINDVSPVPKEYEEQVSTIITNGLQKIYGRIKEVISPAINAIKEIGSTFINSIKSIFQESPEKQTAATKANLKGLYKTYTDLKGVDGTVQEQFLKNHYEKIDQLQTPQELLVETAKITKSIAKAGIQKINNLRQQQQITRKISARHTPTVASANSLTPTSTANNAKSS